MPRPRRRAPRCGAAGCRARRRRTSSRRASRTSGRWRCRTCFGIGRLRQRGIEKRAGKSSSFLISCGPRSRTMLGWGRDGRCGGWTWRESEWLILHLHDHDDKGGAASKGVQGRCVGLDGEKRGDATASTVLSGFCGWSGVNGWIYAFWGSAWLRIVSILGWCPIRRYFKGQNGLRVMMDMGSGERGGVFSLGFIFPLAQVSLHPFFCTFFFFPFSHLLFFRRICVIPLCFISVLFHKYTYPSWPGYSYQLNKALISFVAG